MNPAWLQALSKIRAGQCQNEASLHEHVAAILKREGVEFEHEHRINATDRIDFMVTDMSFGPILYGIECKVHPGGMDVWRQLERYAAACDFLVLITTKPVGRVIAPDPQAHRCRGLWVLELWKNF